MSETWKGWMSKPSVKRKIDGSAWLSERNDGYYCVPVLIQPIEDESLPHPGDGKEWEVDLYGMWEPVIVRMPAIGPDGHERIVVSDQNGVPHMVPPRDLRERKPEPEHEAWCPIRLRPEAYSGDTSVGSLWCKCERRSGEDRRQGERREIGGRRCTDIWSTASKDRRSHRDRRSP